MKTREQIYGQEAASILRDITMYRALTEEQLLRLCPGKRDKVRNLLSYLTKQGRIWHIDGLYCAAPECAEDVDKGLLASVWVLADFIDRVEFHSVGDFPAKLFFRGRGGVRGHPHRVRQRNPDQSHPVRAGGGGVQLSVPGGQAGADTGAGHSQRQGLLHCLPGGGKFNTIRGNKEGGQP